MVNFKGGGDAKTRRDVEFVMASATLREGRGANPTTIRLGIEYGDRTVLSFRGEAPLLEQIKPKKSERRS